jgi:hypothetical protein
MPSQRRSSQGRSLLGPAGVLRYPSTSLLRATPGSASVIPPATEADLPNRQGPCLRNSSPATPLRRQKCLFPDRENATYGSIKAVTTHRSKACQASSQSGLYHPARRWHHPPPTAVRDGKRSNSFPSRPTPREAGGPPGTQEGPPGGHGSPAAHRRSGNQGRRYVTSAAAGSYSTSTGRWSEADRACGVSITRCVRSAGTSAPVTRTASMRRRTPCAP